MPNGSKNGYTWASQNVRGLKTDKDILRAENYPREKVKDLVDKYFPESPIMPENCILVAAPSTTRTNIIPEFICSKIKHDNPHVEIAEETAQALHETKSANKGGLEKIREPVDFKVLNLEQLRGKNVFLVDDVVTTGETTDKIREKFAEHGIFVQGVISAGQSESRKVNLTDMMRMSGKLGEPSVKKEVSEVLTGRLKHRANYIERTLSNDQNKPEIRTHFKSEARRLAKLDERTSQYLRSNESMATRLQFRKGGETRLYRGR